MIRGLFVTGTDTGVGKTEITAGIARLWRRQGRDFCVRKPVVTGGNGDVLKLADAAGVAPESVTRFCFTEPAAPPVAARLEGRELVLEDYVNAVTENDLSLSAVGNGLRAVPYSVTERHEGHSLLVEGVGGLLCPLTATKTVADLVAILGIPLIIVARRSLGTLNHTLMTVEIALMRKLRVVGVVVNETSPVTSVAEENNVEELRSRLSVPILAVVRHRPGGYSEEILDLVDVNWWSLAGA